MLSSPVIAPCHLKEPRPSAPGPLLSVSDSYSSRMPLTPLARPLAHLLPPKLVQYRPQAKTAQHGWPGLPVLDLAIALCRDRSSAHCAVAKLQAAAALWQLSLAHYLSPLPQIHQNETHPICPGGLRCTSIPAKVAICCRRVLGCHPHPSCMGKALGFGVASFKACGCRRG